MAALTGCLYHNQTNNRSQYGGMDRKLTAMRQTSHHSSKFHSVGMQGIEKYLDRRQVALTAKQESVEVALRRAIDFLHQLAGDTKSADGWTMSAREVRANLNPDKPIHAAATRRYSQCKQEAKGVAAELRQIAEAWRQTRWRRYWQVFGGKVHAHAKCSMLNDHTRLELLFEFSGEGDDRLREDSRYALCGRCFPGAAAPKGRDSPACAGSGERAGFDSDPCPHCGKQISKTSAGKFRRHKPG